MPVGDQAILEILLRQIKNAGYHRITIALGHLAHLVQAVVNNGQSPDIKIDYSIEDQPLGTSGPLSLIPNLNETFLVLNGDVLTDLDFQKMLEFHRDNNAVATIATHKRVVNINYGVIRKNGFAVTGYDEKPAIHYEVSMGIYLFEPSVLDHIPHGSHLDFPDLVDILLGHDLSVVSYPHEGIWFDLGRIEDFHQVQAAADKLRKAIPCFHT
jgi:NDP-sugar pyrophosphorylase family protein